MRNGMWGSREEENYYNPMQGMAADDKRIECGGLTRNFKVSSHTHTHTERTQSKEEEEPNSSTISSSGHKAGGRAEYMNAAGQRYHYPLLWTRILSALDSIVSTRPQFHFIYPRNIKLNEKVKGNEEKMKVCDVTEKQWRKKNNNLLSIMAPLSSRQMS